MALLQGDQSQAEARLNRPITGRGLLKRQITGRGHSKQSITAGGLLTSLGLKNEKKMSTFVFCDYSVSARVAGIEDVPEHIHKKKQKAGEKKGLLTCRDSSSDRHSASS